MCYQVGRIPLLSENRPIDQLEVVVLAVAWDSHQLKEEVYSHSH